MDEQERKRLQEQAFEHLKFYLLKKDHRCRNKRFGQFIKKIK